MKERGRYQISTKKGIDSLDLQNRVKKNMLNFSL